MRILLLGVSLFLLLTSEQCEQVNSDTYVQTAEDVIELEKTICFGRCPSFVFTINGIGEATYNGRQFAERQGMHSKTFGPKETNALFQAFEEKDFWSFEDEYTANVSDLPTTYLTLKKDGREKKITLYFDVPQTLISLSNLTKSFADTEEWEKN